MLLMGIQIIPIKSMLKSKALIVFHDIITDMISNKNFTHQSLNFYWSQETTHFSCNYFTIILQNTKAWYTKHYTLLYHEDF